MTYRLGYKIQIISFSMVAGLKRMTGAGVPMGASLSGLTSSVRRAGRERASGLGAIPRSPPPCPYGL